jgi:hypothetical protein
MMGYEGPLALSGGLHSQIESRRGLDPMVSR